MVERFYMRENLSFEKVELEFQKGLILFTGPSGAGKSVLMNGMLSAIAQKSGTAKLAEIVFNQSINLDKFGIEREEYTVFKQIKKDKLRYFVNNQVTSKKVVSQIGKLFINHLNPREIVEFNSDYLIEIFNSMIPDKQYRELLQKYSSLFEEYENLKKSLLSLDIEIQKIAEREDFIKFEISQIASINPSIGEDKELAELKKKLGKKEELENHLQEANSFFESRDALLEIFNLMNLEDEFVEIENFCNRIEERVGDIQFEISKLDEVNVEKVLNRIEILAELKEKYGSLEKTLQYKTERENELKELAKLRNKRKEIEKTLKKMENSLISLALEISAFRQNKKEDFEKKVNRYLKLLNLGALEVLFSEKKFSENGVDKLSLKVANTEISKLSYGEQNRVRLAILTLKTKFRPEEGTLFLDEIDSNLSGEESMRVAKVLKELSKSYQVFAISHQPQLTSQADQHFLVYKKNGKSSVELLNSKEKRAKEIMRMVGGANSNDAYNFALSLLERI